MDDDYIIGLDPITFSDTMNDDKFVVYDASEGRNRRIDRSQIALSVANDLGGAHGSFTTADGKTVTVVAGLITSII